MKKRGLSMDVRCKTCNKVGWFDIYIFSFLG